MARERLSLSTSTPSPRNVPPSSAYSAGSSSKQVSRLPVNAKRPVLGERVENLEHATPRQHLVKSVKSVVKPRLSSSTTKSLGQSKRRSLTVAFSPSTSVASTPAGANLSRPGSTPHPRRSSIGLDGLLGDADDTMLMDMRAQEYLLSESETSDNGNAPWLGARKTGRGVPGVGRMMTPENSQENRIERGTDKRASTPRAVIRLPTPPSSQPDHIELPITKSLVRPRPEPTPPRYSASAASRLAQSLAPPSQNSSPNPRRRKSPKVGGEEETPRLRSPFNLDNISTPASSSQTPRNRMEVVIVQPRKSASLSPPAASTSQMTPQAQAPKRGRPSIQTPRLSQSTSSRTKAKQAPSTAPPFNRRKSISQAKTKKPSPRASLPAPAKGRSSLSKSLSSSVIRGKRKKMVGILPEPVEQGSPSDDPLLLIEDDESSWGTPSASSQSRARSSASTIQRAKPGSAARIIDFDALLAHNAARSALDQEGATETYEDYQVPVQGSEPDYCDGPAWGNESDRGSDMDDVGNDTFAHVTGGSASQMIGEDTLGLRTRDIPPIEAPTATPRSASHPASSPVLPDVEIGEPDAGDLTVVRPVESTTPASSPKRLEMTTTPAGSPDRFDFARSPTVVPSSPGLSKEFDEQPVTQSPAFAKSAAFNPNPQSTPARHALSPVSRSPAPFATPNSVRSSRFGSRTKSPFVEPAANLDVSAASPSTRMSAASSPRALAIPSSARSRTRSPVAFTAAEDFSSSPLGSPSGSVSARQQSSRHSSPIALPHEMRSESPALGALGLFLHDEDEVASANDAADVQPLSSRASTPIVDDHIGHHEEEDVTHDEDFAHSPTLPLSTTPLGPPPPKLDVTSSPRVPKSPLPTLLEPEEESEVAHPEPACSTPATQVQTDLGAPTTPLYSPSSKTPVRQPFSPRYASPLRAVQARPLSPEKIESAPHASRSPVTYEPVPPSFEEEADDATVSGDVTLEGDSLDWSLSENEELASADSSMEGEVFASTTPPPQETAVEVTDVMVDINSSQEDEQQDASSNADFDELDTSLARGADASAEDESSGDAEPAEQASEHDQTTTPDSSADEPIGPVIDSPAEDVGLESGDVTIDGDSADWSLSDQTASEEDNDEDELGENAHREESASPEEPPAPNTPDELDDSPNAEAEDGEGAAYETTTPDPNRKIILSLINVGTIKVEAEDHRALPTPPYTAREPVSQEADESDAFHNVPMSTTPRYSPPRRAIPSVPASPLPSLQTKTQDALPGSPATPAPVLRRLSLANAAAVPSLESMLRSRISSGGRPSSRLTRQVVQHDDEQDDAEQSIRVRSRPSLGDELYEADESMRSVVEVSSLNPRAAARAAAILKMNHAYIEHGDLTKIDKSQRSTTPRRESFKASLPGKVDKTELLHEAELEIVSTRRSRSRSMSRFRGVSEAPTDLHLPGAWNGTPKRKRPLPNSETISEEAEPPRATKAWGVSQWKKLEKVFRAERELWTKEREVKSMPGGFIGWARRSTFGSPAPVMKEWDPMRVVDRFVEEQKIATEAQVGEWSLDMLRTRVEALERHAEHRKVKNQQEATNEAEPSPKKAKMATPIKSKPPAVPESSVRRMFNWALGSSVSKKSGLSASTVDGIEHSAVTPTSDLKGKGKAKEVDVVDNPPIPDSPAMSQIGRQPVSHSSPPRSKLGSFSSAFTPIETSFSIPHPSSPVWRPSEPVRPPTARPAPIASLLAQSRPTPKTLSAILAASSTSSTSSNDGQYSTSRLYPTLEPSMSQRSAAINALFAPGNKSATSVSKPIGMPVKRSSSVKDLVKSLEDSGVMSKGKEKESDLRRVQSRPV